MCRIFHPILYLLACATRQELARQVHYLRVENEILRAKLPKTIRTTADERRRLVKAARGLGRDLLQSIVSIVSPQTLLKWLNREGKPSSGKAPSTRKPGRPRTPDDVRELIVRIATETGWGYTRIRGELRKLGIEVSRQTVVNILKEHDLDPGPQRGRGTWDEFLKIHWHTLWQCDFFSKKCWTWRGPVDLYLLVFIHVGSRKVWISSATEHPDSAWVAQQARNFCMEVPEGDSQRALVFHDSDTKFTEQFREILRAEGLRPKKLIPVSPNLNAFVERFIQTLGQECLDHFVVLGERHLNRIVGEFVRYYHQFRPHQGLGNRVPVEREGVAGGGEVVGREFLGGLLRHYERRAA